MFAWLGRLRDWYRARTARPRCVVECDEIGVVCRRPDGTSESIGWNSLEQVTILTNGLGPWADDVFFVLEGTGYGCVVPHGSEGDNRLVERLQRLPGFDNHALMAAMSSTDDATFVCWRRPAGGTA